MADFNDSISIGVQRVKTIHRVKMILFLLTFSNPATSALVPISSLLTVAVFHFSCEKKKVRLIFQFIIVFLSSMYFKINDKRKVLLCEQRTHITHAVQQFCVVVCVYVCVCVCCVCVLCCVCVCVYVCVCVCVGVCRRGLPPHGVQGYPFSSSHRPDSGIPFITLQLHTAAGLTWMPTPERTWDPFGCGR